VKLSKVLLLILIFGAVLFAQPNRAKAMPIADSLIVRELNVQNTSIKALLQGMAVQYGLNLIIDKEVDGAVSVNFSNLPLKEALHLIVTENGFQYQIDNNTIKIFKPKVSKVNNFDKLELTFKDSLLDLDVKNAELDDVIRRIVEATGRTVILEKGANMKFSLLLKAVEFPKAIRIIAESNNLSLRENDGIYTIYRDQWMNNSSTTQQSPGLRGKLWVSVDDGLVSMDVVNAPIKKIMSLITSQAGINTVIYGDLSGNVSAKVNQVSVSDALKYLFRGTEFTFWESKGIFFIGPHQMQTANNSMLIKLKHMKAEEALKLLPSTLMKNTQIQVVKSQNGLMAVGNYENLDAIQQYIEKMDLPIAQILIEALVVDVDLEKVRSYGIDLFIGDAAKRSSAETIYPAFEQVLNKKQSEDVLAKVGLNDVISLPKNFAAKVKALEQEKILDVKSKSQIATLNGETAVLTIGQTQYFLLKSETDYNQGNAVTNRTTERFEKVEANVTLTVTPYVTGRREVTCEIVPDFSEPEGSFDASVPPTLNKRYVKSSVRLKDGETIILGGMVKEITNDVHRQVPFLGSIPILGWLFKNVDTVRSRSQLLIFITPRIYYDSEGSVDPDKYMQKNKIQ